MAKKYREWSKNVQKLVTLGVRKLCKSVQKIVTSRRRKSTTNGALILYVCNQIQGSSTLSVTAVPGWELFGVSEDGAAAEEYGWAWSELETKEELAGSEDSGLLLLALEDELVPLALQAAKRNKDINKVKRFFILRIIRAAIRFDTGILEKAVPW